MSTGVEQAMSEHDMQSCKYNDKQQKKSTGGALCVSLVACVCVCVCVFVCVCVCVCVCV